MFEGPIQLINQAKKILLLTHKDAGGDGDALGSLLGLSIAFSKLGIKSCPFINEEIASKFCFLPGLELLDSKIPEDADLVILIDFADLKRGSICPPHLPSILIDHHPKGDLYSLSTFQIYDEGASSAAELVYLLIKELRVAIDKEIATLLLTGIFTDTNSFQNPNTTPRTMEIASALLSYGGRLSKIVENIFYEKPIDILKLWGKAMRRLKKNEKYDLLVTVLTSQDFLECGTRGKSNGIVNFLSLVSLSSKGVLLLSEENGKIKGSLRTGEEIDISKLAKILGGGGHKKAAGFEIEGKLKIDGGEWKIT